MNIVLTYKFEAFVILHFVTLCYFGRRKLMRMLFAIILLVKSINNYFK